MRDNAPDDDKICPDMENEMANYVDSGSQLVVEVYTNHYIDSLAFYLQYGFEMVRDEGNFAELRWEDSLLFIEEVKDAPAPPFNVGNIRVMVSDVDRYWQMALELGSEVIKPIGDRYYGLRDFTIAGPDGLGLRFASTIGGHSRNV